MSLPAAARAAKRLLPSAWSYTGVTYRLGADGVARDVRSAIFYGLRASLRVGDRPRGVLNPRLRR